MSHTHQHLSRTVLTIQGHRRATIPTLSLGMASRIRLIREQLQLQTHLAQLDRCRWHLAWVRRECQSILHSQTPEGPLKYTQASSIH